MMVAEKATLGGGCFWCLEAVFGALEGVLKAEPGYSGGHLPNPDYESVCGGKTGHAEVVRLTFDPERLSYREILAVFFSIHDPTTLNRQGNDVGTQYRSVIFYHSDEQKKAAENMIGQMRAAVVSEVVPAGEFYPAENFHRNYYANHPLQPYCRLVVEPKLEKFKRQFAAQLKQG